MRCYDRDTEAWRDWLEILAIPLGIVLACVVGLGITWTR